MNDERPKHPKIEIRSRWGNDEILYSTHTCPDLKSAVEEAVSKKTDLVSADLRYADLRYADLVSANLVSADLRYANLVSADLVSANLRYANLVSANLVSADLRYADLRYADLVSANLRYANLRYANLRYAKINWSSHELISQILLVAAGEDIERRKIAGLILVSPDWCWEKWLRMRKSHHFVWAMDEMASYVQPGDNAPEVLRDRAAKPKELVAMEEPK